MRHSEFRFRIINGVSLHAVEDLYTLPASSQWQGNTIILTTTKGGNCDALQLESHPTSTRFNYYYEAHNAPECIMKFLHNYTKSEM